MIDLIKRFANIKRSSIYSTSSLSEILKSRYQSENSILIAITFFKAHLKIINDKTIFTC